MQGNQQRVMAFAMSLAFAAAVCSASAGTSCPAITLDVRDGTTTSYGESLALDGDVAIIGATTGGPAETGTVHVFRKVGGAWVHEQELLPSDGEWIDRFAEVVALDSDWALVRAVEFGFMGDKRVYVFHYDGSSWTETQQLLVEGGALDIHGDLLIAQNDSNSVVIFRLAGATWVQEQVLTSPDTAVNGFGTTLAIRDDVALVGQPNPDPPGPGDDPGRVHVFRHVGSQWVHQQMITPDDDLTPWKGFGEGLAMSRGSDGKLVAIISAPSTYETDDSTPFTPQFSYGGPAYAFRDQDGAWMQEHKFDVPRSTYPRFGWELDIDEDRAVIAADGGAQYPAFHPNEKFVHRYDAGQWSLDQVLYPIDDGPAYSMSGFHGVSVSGGNVVACKWASANAYALDAAPADLDCDGQVGGFDLAALLASWGPCDGCAADLNDDAVVNGLDLAILLGMWG